MYFLIAYNYILYGAVTSEEMTIRKQKSAIVKNLLCLFDEKMLLVLANLERNKR